MKPRIESSGLESDSVRSPITRLAAAAGIAALSLVASAPLAAGSVTIGQLAPGSPPLGYADPSGTLDTAQLSVTSGNSYVAPGNGTITSWSHNAAAGAGQTLTFKVYRQLTGSTYMVIGHDGPRAVVGGVLNTFPSSITVKSGDIIGLYFDVAPPAKASIFVVPGGSYLSRTGNLADGASGDFVASTDKRVNATASLRLSNAFSFGDVDRNKKKGTATLTVEDVPNRGELVVAGKGVGAASAGRAVIAKTVSAPGDVRLKIRASGKKKRKLNETGKVQLKPRVTFTPTGGDPNTESTNLKLKKRR